MRNALVWLGLLVASPAPAQQVCEGEAFDAFDFWVGEWRVAIADGTVAGQNRIERRDGGCVVIEEWTSARGNTGTSLNYYDVARDQWVQIWGGAGGSQIDIRGGMTDGSMVLTGTLTTVKDKSSKAFRGTWTPLDDGRIRQFFEQSDDGGKTWSPWFEGFYTRIEPTGTG